MLGPVKHMHVRFINFHEPFIKRRPDDGGVSSLLLDCEKAYQASGARLRLERVAKQGSSTRLLSTVTQSYCTLYRTMSCQSKSMRLLRPFAVRRTDPQLLHSLLAMFRES